MIFLNILISNQFKHHEYTHNTIINGQNNWLYILQIFPKNSFNHHHVEIHLKIISDLYNSQVWNI